MPDKTESSGHDAANQADIPPEVMEVAASGEGVELVRAFSRVGDLQVRSRIAMLVKSLGEHDW